MLENEANSIEARADTTWLPSNIFFVAITGFASFILFFYKGEYKRLKADRYHENVTPALSQPLIVLSDDDPRNVSAAANNNNNNNNYNNQHRNRTQSGGAGLSSLSDTDANMVLVGSSHNSLSAASAAGSAQWQQASASAGGMGGVSASGLISTVQSRLLADVFSSENKYGPVAGGLRD